jgi:ABC-type Fe3+-hydroxamate transport system substrate-binding protein
MHDDLGHPLRLERPTRRIVSLVPSLTESVALSIPGALVGATDWCSHPANLQVTRVRGTKNPNLAAIIALQPDLVLANKEENRESDVAALRDAGIAVWVTDIETVEQAFVSLRRLFTEALESSVPGWLEAAEREWSQPLPASGVSVAVPVWRDPWMVVGSRTFTGDLIARLGFRNVYAEHAERYPHVDLAQLRGHAPDAVLLPDEPYLFTASDGPEAFPGVPIALVEGRILTWYGPSLEGARDRLTAQIAAARPYPFAGSGTADDLTGGGEPGSEPE